MMTPPSREQRRAAYRQEQRRTRILWGALAVVVLVVVVWFATARLRSTANVTGDAAEIALGEQVYVTHCAECHGAQLEGEPNWQAPNDDGTMKAPPHDVTGHTWHHGDAYLLDRIRNGTRMLDAATQAASDMPAYEGVLTEAEMSAVLTYIKSHWPADIQRAQAQRSAAEQP